MASKRRNMFQKNKTQETTENDTCNLPPFCDLRHYWSSEVPTVIETEPFKSFHSKLENQSDPLAEPVLANRRLQMKPVRTNELRARDDSRCQSDRNLRSVPRPTMKIIPLVAALLSVLALANAQRSRCHVACPSTYDPVCATDAPSHRTFSNMCMMNAHNTCYRTLAYGQGGACGMNCPIDIVYTPYCTIDRHYRLRTFGSRCLLDAYNKCYGHSE
ncbi:hypothetical protein AAG570_002237 [Ranatra chinensis]|uniref:Kazal-like domain-containing protein n=1 Tax=Ranatra chinensis TaxID=642074 RepID=A0ABD0Y6Y8_9HEMI